AVAVTTSAVVAGATTSGLRHLLQLNQPGIWIEWTPMLALGLLGFVVCVIAVASWGMQPGFALIGGPLVAGLATWPLWWHALAESSAHISTGSKATLRTDAPWEPFNTAIRNPSLTLWACVIIGALFSTWFAFISRKSNRKGIFLWLPVATTLLGVIPAWTSWGIDRYQETHCYPGTERFQIESAFVGSEAKFAFLNVASNFGNGDEVPGVPLKVNLETGEWETVAGMDSKWTSPFKDGHTRWHLNHFGEVKTVTMTSSDASANGVHWDANAGFPTIDALPREPVHTRPVPKDLGLGSNYKVSTELGHGFALSNRLDREAYLLYDSTRNKAYPFPRRRIFYVRVTRHGWLLRKITDADELGPWLLYDPETESYSQAEGLQPTDFLGATLTDGRVFGANASGVFIYDPASKTRTPLRDTRPLPPSPPNHHVTRPDNLLSYSGPIDPRGPILIRVRGENKSNRGLVNLQAHSFSRIESPSGGAFIAMSGTNKCIVLVDKKRLEEFDFKTGQSRILFPRPKGQE
ncbi:MAG: hypothetical protein P1V35_14355, partial [Planctomycetota bacterium]|nr:hypothetical protein [Planctomycetota bacterium]